MAGIVIVDKAKAHKDATVYLLPYRLRLIRATKADNGFCGVRTVTNQVAFLKDLAAEQMLNKESGDYPPEEEDEDTKKNAVDSPNAVYSAIEEGDYMTSSPGGFLKYLICNPEHRWALWQHEGVIHLISVSQASAKKAFKSNQLVEVNMIASFL